MSYKIRDRIAKLKGVPSKYKRVLDAWATFANKDGSNIHPSKEAVAERAGISRWTVYENTTDLIEVGVLVDTGKTHAYGAGHYTTVYCINTAMLESPTLLGEKLCSKILHRQCSKTPKTNVAKPHATLPIDPRSLTLTDQKETPPTPEAKQVSKQVASELPPKAKTEPPVQVWCVDNIDDMAQMQKNFGPDYPVGRAYDLISKLGCNVKDQNEWLCFLNLMGFFSDNMPDHPERSLWAYWNYNQQHKTGGLVHYSLADAWVAIQSDNRKGAFPQFKKHQQLTVCPKHCYEKFPELVGDGVFAEAFEVEEDIHDTDCTAHQHKRGTCPTGSACHPNAPEYRKEHISW
jgi:hypothetical protein